MKKDRIRGKLEFFLKAHETFKEECEVIYLMVQIRKILDCESNSYNILRFYCNLTLHNKLSREQTTKLLSDILYSEFNAFKDFLKFNKFKKELKEFFKNYDLPADLLNKNWWGFARLLLEIIKECEVNFVQGEKMKLNIIKNNDNEFDYKFSSIDGKGGSVVWKVKLKKK